MTIRVTVCDIDRMSLGSGRVGLATDHRHYFGVVASVEFTSFDDIEDQFQNDWTALRSKA